eukprot:Skav200749  [mRNA]  locus=scaffold1117:128120:129190:+ [translate_table: standard]
MACASHVQYVVVEASDCQYWQMIAAMWMGRYMELVAPLCSGQWPSWAPCWQTSECNQGFCDLESNAEPPQTHGAQWGRDVTNSGATSDVPQAFAVSGLESVHEPNEKRRKTKCEDEVPCSDSGRHLSCVDDFEVALMESYMQTIFDCDFETDLQIDWSEEGWCSVNLHDMPGVLGRPWPKPSFQVGESVQLHRLKAARYNGQIGKVITELQAHGRHGVRLHNGQCISVSVSNTLCVEDTPRPSQEKKGYKMFSSDSGHHISCVDDFDVGLMESSMRTLFDCDIETDLQIDWSRDGSCNVNLRDMLGGTGLLKVGLAAWLEDCAIQWAVRRCDYRITRAWSSRSTPRKRAGHFSQQF